MFKNTSSNITHVIFFQDKKKFRPPKITRKIVLKGPIIKIMLQLILQSSPLITEQEFERSFRESKSNNPYYNQSTKVSNENRSES